MYYSHILLPILSSLTGVPILLIGDPGSGKTTLAELIALMYGAPVDATESLGVKRGSPDITAEDFIARLELPEMKRIIVNPWMRFPIKFIDEINRLPEKQQNNLIGIIEGVSVYYLDRAIEPITWSFMGTANYPDAGNNPLIPPVADRFGVSVEIPTFDPVEGTLIFKRSTNNTREQFKDRSITKRLEELLSNVEDESLLEAIDETVEPFREKLRRLGLDSLLFSEAKQIREEIESVPVSDDAEIFLSVLLSELNLKWKENEHYKHTKYAFNFIDGSYSEMSISVLSNRALQYLSKLSKALAWSIGYREVRPEHIAAIAPYVIAHRAVFSEEAFDIIGGRVRGYANIKLAKAVVGRIYEHYDIAPELFKQAHALSLSKVAEIEANPEKAEEIIDKYVRILDSFSQISDHPFIGTMEDLIRRTGQRAMYRTT
jgi:MoxR-like ATPase